MPRVSIIIATYNRPHLRPRAVESAKPGTTIPCIEDLNLWIRIAELYPFLAVEQPVVIYRKATSDFGRFTSDAAVTARRISDGARPASLGRRLSCDPPVKLTLHLSSRVWLQAWTWRSS